jgi:prevent-host-death family protein
LAVTFIGAILSAKYRQKDNAMKISADIKPVSYLKLHSADLLNQVNETHRPVIITQNGEPRAVLQDADSYEDMRVTLGLLKLLAQAENDVRQGGIVPQAQVFDNLEILLAK